MLVGTDGTEATLEGLRRALALVAADEVVLVTVVPEELDTGAGGIEGPDESPEELDRLAREHQVEGRSVLTRTEEALGLVGVTARVAVGDPGATLCDVAAAEDADLLLVGSHGRGPVARVLLGSVSDYVIRHAPCPVLVTRVGARGDGERSHGATEPGR